MYYNSVVRLPALPYPKHNEDNLKRNQLEIIFILYVCESAYVSVVSYIKYICHLALWGIGSNTRKYSKMKGLGNIPEYFNIK